MDNEIKRLLKLEQIKGFKLLESEKKRLAEWKSQQKRVKPVKKEKLPKGHVELEMGVEDTPIVVPKSELGEVVKNVVAPEEKETGKIEG